MFGADDAFSASTQMQSTSTSPTSGEPKFSRAVFDAIVRGLGEHNSSCENFECREDGVWLKDVDSLGDLAWHPMGELTEIDGSDPLELPWLPFPFTARQLAAFMVYGCGYSIREKYGAWEDGPSADVLRDLPQRAARAVQALEAAYKAYRQAVSLAPSLDRNLERTALELSKAFDAVREEALCKEGLPDSDVIGAEYTKRIERVNKAVSDLGSKASSARRAADDAFQSWRRAVVQNLLLPANEVPERATGPNYALLATRARLSAAFGAFGLKTEWFNSPSSHKWLFAARKVTGRGQKGYVEEPMYCPLEVMTGLTKKARPKRLTEKRGWQILEEHFPEVYAANALADPRDPPG